MYADKPGTKFTASKDRNYTEADLPSGDRLCVEI